MFEQDLYFIILTLAIHTRNRNHEPKSPRIVSFGINSTLVYFLSMLHKASFVTPKGFFGCCSSNALSALLAISSTFHPWIAIHLISFEWPKCCFDT